MLEYLNYLNPFSYISYTIYAIGALYTFIYFNYKNVNNEDIKKIYRTYGNNITEKVNNKYEQYYNFYKPFICEYLIRPLINFNYMCIGFLEGLNDKMIYIHIDENIEFTINSNNKLLEQLSSQSQIKELELVNLPKLEVKDPEVKQKEVLQELKDYFTEDLQDLTDTDFSSNNSNLTEDSNESNHESNQEEITVRRTIKVKKNKKSK